MDKRDELLPLVREYLWVISLTLLALGMIVWAAVIVWVRPCRSAGFSDCPSLLWDFETLLLAVGIWVIALVVQIMERRRVAAALFLLCAGALATGKLSAMGSDIGGRLFYGLLAWLTPLIFHFSQAILDRPAGRLGRFVLVGLYAVAMVGTLPFLFWPIITLESQGEFSLLRLGIRLILALGFVLGWILLLRHYRSSSRLVRQRIRLTVFGTLFAATPLLLLSLVPETFGASVYVPYEWTLPWLILSPLSYVYSLLRWRLQRAEVVFNRLAVYYLTITILLGLYLTAATFLNYLTARPSNYWPLGSALLGVGLVLLFAPLQRLLQHLMTWILYGSEIHYAEIIGRFAETFALTLDRESLSHLLLVEWPHAMRFLKVSALLKNSDSTLSLLGASDELKENLIDLQIPAEGHLSVYLQSTPAPIPDRQVKKSLAQYSLKKEEASLLDLSGISYWLPLVSGGTLQGLLLIGRPHDDPFSAEDERILATMAHQAGIAAHNACLTEEIRLARNELTRAHQQLLVERDQNQRRLALELHDEGIQELMGILFQVNRMQRDLSHLSKERGQNTVGKRLTETLLSVRDQTQSLVAYLRSVTYELYPPGLEEMGLTLALESYANHLKRQNNLTSQCLKIDMDKIGSADLALPMATSIFRAAQEGLRNALNHAQAKNVTLCLRRSTTSITLSIIDDGCGFRVPARLSELARRGHFGLVGIAERVAWAGGELTIHSNLGTGTEVIVHVPNK